MTDPTSQAEEIFDAIADLAILSPHGHTVPDWFAQNQPFSDPAELLIIPDHYVFRMLYSQGMPLDSLGIGVPPADRNPRAIFRRLADHWHLFLGTPSRQWMEYTLTHVFGIEIALTPQTADAIYDAIDEELKTPAFLPCALLDRLHIDVLATTDSALDDLAPHAAFAKSGNGTRLIPTFRPDAVTDPLDAGFAANLEKLGEMTGENTALFAGYLAALANRRAVFKRAGATATDHGVATLATELLDSAQMQALLDKALAGDITQAEADQFSNHMLIEMARMSVEDGLVMQIHAGCARSTNAEILQRYGRDMGGDIPMRTNWVHGLTPLLNHVGNDPSLGIIAFTLDESTYARELAPMAGHWPALKLGPPWWFHDSPGGIARYFDRVVETAGYYNLAGFNDDTRALMSIPARHIMWRQAVSRHLADQVAAGRFTMSDAHDLARWLAYDAAASAYRLIA